jgi:hypothetical protein
MTVKITSLAGQRESIKEGFSLQWLARRLVAADALAGQRQWT